MKTVYYVANIVRAYREAIDTYYKDPKAYEYNPEWFDEIKKASHREFTKGFYQNKPTDKDQLYTSSSYIREYDFIGVVLSYDADTKMATIEQRNHFKVGDKIEIIGPNYYQAEQVIEQIINDQGESIEKAPHAQQIIKVPMASEVEPYYILRKPKEDLHE